MKASQKKLLAALLILIAAMAVIAGCTPQGDNMGVIDMNEVIKESPKAQVYQNELDQKGAQIQEKYKAISDQKLSEEEKQKQQEAALQEFIDAKKQLEDKLNSEIEEAVKTVAKEKKLDIVFYKQSVRYGGVDITQEVVNRLK